MLLFRQRKANASPQGLNLKKDPPPELVVEVDITHRSVAREPIYAGLGVPEIWRWDGSQLQCLGLVNGHYRPRERSLVFPFLAPADLTRFIRLWSREGESAIVRKFRDWVATNGWMK